MTPVRALAAQDEPRRAAAAAQRPSRATCRSSVRGRASSTRPSSSSRTTSTGSSSRQGITGPLAGDRTRQLDVRRGARDGRRLRSRLVARTRPPASCFRTPFALLRAATARHDPARVRTAGASPSSGSATGARTSSATSRSSQCAELRWICDSTGDASSRSSRRYPDVRTRARFDDDPRRRPSTPSRSRRRSRRTSRSPRRRSRPASTSSSRSRSPPPRARPSQLMRARRRARARAHARPHVPLQPAGDHDPRAHRSGRARRHLLHLDEPRESRPPPDATSASSGTSARTTSRSSATGSTRRRRTCSALSRGCVIPAIPDVAFINLEFPSGTIAHVELSWLAPSKLRRTTIVGSREDGRLRRHEHRAGPGLRLRRELRGPGDVRRVPAHLPHRRHRLPRDLAREPLSLELGDFCEAIRPAPAPRSSAAARARGRPDDRGRRRLARRAWRARSTVPGLGRPGRPDSFRLAEEARFPPSNPLLVPGPVSSASEAARPELQPQVV